METLPQKATGKIYFLRRATIDSPYKNLDILPSIILKKLSLIPKDGDIEINQAETLALVKARDETLNLGGIDYILATDARRCLATSIVVQEYIQNKYNQTVRIDECYLLDEIKFRIEKICPRFLSEYQTLDKKFIDEQIFKASLNADWCESLKEIYWRLEYLFDLLGQNKNQKDILVVGHEYLMRFIELFIKQKNVREVALSNLLSTQINYPLHGFITNTHGDYFATLPTTHEIDRQSDQSKLKTTKPPKIYFLRHDKVASLDENLDILPTIVLKEYKLIRSGQQVEIDSKVTYDLIGERNSSVPFEEVDIIFSAQSKRCLATAAAAKNFIRSKYGHLVQINRFYLLDEIIFRLDKIIPNFKDEHQALSREFMDEQIFKALIEQRWSESISQIFWRLEYLFSLFNQVEYQHKTLLIFGHEYFLRLAQLFITHGCQLKSKPNTIEDLKLTTRCYPLHGFVTDVRHQQLEFLPLPKYIQDKKTKNMNEPELYFLRHSIADLPFCSHSEMPNGMIKDLTLSSLDPAIQKQKTYALIQQRNHTLPFDKVKVVFCAQSARSRETAEMIRTFIFQQHQTEVEIVTLPYLNEIQFNVQKLYPSISNGTEQVNLDLLNQSVLKAMILGCDCESIRQAYWKIEFFFEILQKYHQHKRALVITHDYLMRAIELYIKNRDYRMVTFDDIIKTQRNTYLNGFATDFKCSFLEYLSPVHRD